MHIFGCSGNNLVKLPKLEIPSIYSIKEKSLWLFRLYDENYLGHLIAINDESRLFIYKINQGAKTVIEEAFCVLGPVRESYGVSIIDNLIVVSYLQVNWDSQVIFFNNSSNLQAKDFRRFSIINGQNFNGITWSKFLGPGFDHFRFERRPHRTRPLDIWFESKPRLKFSWTVPKTCFKIWKRSQKKSKI